MTTTNTTNKPFLIGKWQVYEAYKAVKSNQGAAGVDGQTIEAFERYKGHKVRAAGLVEKLARTRPDLFMRWRLGMTGAFARWGAQ
jgi:hypothetical protein